MIVGIIVLALIIGVFCGGNKIDPQNNVPGPNDDFLRWVFGIRRDQ